LTKAGCPGNSPRSDGEEMDLGRVWKLWSIQHPVENFSKEWISSTVQESSS
jgi:hypothetical protein